MGSGNSKGKNIRPSTRLIPREPLQEKFLIPEEEPGYPTVRTPATLKKDIYNPKDNRDIYFHALHAPSDIEDSWDDLVDYLTSIYRTDMMKVRSIFSWLGIQEIEKENFFMIPTPNSVDEITPRGYKKVIKSREGSYATLFALLCRKSGIKCAIVNGISKGYGYEVGQKEVSQLRDRWCAVYIDGWRLIHPLWAYKNIISFKRGKWVPQEHLAPKLAITDVTEDEVDHDFNEYYFLVDPGEFVTVCLPDNEKWQLSGSRMTMEKWIDMPHLQKRYHMEGFKIASEFKSTLHAKNGICGLVVRAPQNKQVDYQLAYDFYFNHINNKPEVEEPIYLARYVLMSRDSRENKWSFEARMPLPGTYRVTVYGGPSNKPQLPWISDVAVICDTPAKNVQPYPDSPKIGFGPVNMTERCGLTEPSHPNGALFVNPRQMVHITFKLTETIIARAELVGVGIQEKEMSSWVKCTINNQSKLQILDVVVEIQKEGEYALRIHTRARDIKTAWKNACNYYMSTDPPRSNGVVVKDKGYKTARELNARKALDEASKGKDLFELKSAVQKFKNEGLHEVDGSFGRATNKMEYLELVKGLKDAINRRNLDMLNTAIKQAREYEHAPKLQNLIEQAQTERDKLMAMDRFMHDVLEMKQSTISEMISYQKPMTVIHDVLIATLLLLGEKRSHLQFWDDVKAIMRQTGQASILRRLRAFDINKISSDTLFDVNRVISAYDEDTVRTASAGAGTFFIWAKSIIEERSTNSNDSVT